MRVSILLLASGRGTRLESEIPKAFVPVAGRPLVVRSLERLRRAVPDAEAVLAVHPDDRDRFVAPLADVLDALGLTAVVDGGATRQDSMRHAFAASDPRCDVVLVHDAARPFLPVAATREVVERAAEVGAALLAVPAPDTLKRAGPTNLVEATVDRSSVWLAQTPQAIRRDRLVEALRIADRDGFVGTDDVSLCEHAGMPVALVRGDRRNLKITTPDDLVIADALSRLEDDA